ncbi:MAG: hypothetical protein HYX55_03425 [Chloroflexi bacterium]|nr:hypothetical protein [Chloroflexota bacterium]
MASASIAQPDVEPVELTEGLEGAEQEAIEAEVAEPEVVAPPVWHPAAAPAAPRAPEPRPPFRPAPAMDSPRIHAEGEDAAAERTATAPQLRRFIKSRAYVPMHELRRRFAINGGDDEVTQVDLERKRIFVGLPEREGRLLGELLRAGDIGYELSLDPISPIVVGVYPMRPVTRV